MIKGIALLIAGLSAVAIGAMKPEDFAYRRLLTAPDSSSGELAAFRLDNAMYRNTNDGFSDMRIFDGQGKEVAFGVRRVMANDTDTVHYTIPLKTGSFRKETREGAAIVFYRDKKDSIPTLLDINTPTRNFEKSVSVLGSNDQRKWETLAADRPVFDYTQFIDIRNTAVEFQRREYKYYKVQIDSVWSFKRSAFSSIVTESEQGSRYTGFMQHQEPFRLDAITFSGKVKRVRYGEQLHESEDLHIDSVYEDTTHKASLLFLSSHREPVGGILLSVAASNFTRRVAVHATNDTAGEADWKQLGSAELFSINTGNYKSHQLTIPLGTGRRFSRYRLQIENQDNAPVTVSAVTGEGPRHEVLFFNRGLKTVYVYYGAEEPVVPQYDIETVLKKTPVVEGALWQPGAPEKVAPHRKKAPFIDPKVILFGVLVLMVVVLVMVLGVAVRKVDENTGGKK